MILSATQCLVVQLMLRQGLVLVAIGIIVGLAGVAAVSRSLVTLLFGLTPLDPITFVGVALLLAVVAGLADWMPAYRATVIDQLVASHLNNGFTPPSVAALAPRHPSGWCLARTIADG
jgi:hypothetical protein